MGKKYQMIDAVVSYIDTPVKGILVADESIDTIHKWFTGIKVEKVEANCHTFRELLFRALETLLYLNEVIFFEETLY
ncbi:hypothetical protein KSP40_PGU016338 [Platanthera guangdongensis]|uniref:fructose-bisphosphate aldolase n=1 Tax=Platanthera guangdongensis TaxID=2320717 RepID=A0ABR2M074_9ASPA